MSDDGRHGWIGNGFVPHGSVGWDGYWGTVPLQGPAPRPKDWVDPPKPEEIAEAEVVTSWTCPFCKAGNEVHGEGAVYSWMECMACFKYAWLEMA